LKKKGLKAYWILSLGGIISCLRARYYFFDCFTKDINHWLSRGAKKINLWHGETPFKKSERDIDNTRSRYYQLFHGSRLVRMALATVMPWHLVRSEFYICTSPFLACLTQSTFGADEADVIVTGYPRNDTFLQGGGSRAEGALADLAKTLAEIPDRGKVLCYLPTFRDDGSAFIDFDWPAVEGILRQHGAILVYKLHPQDFGRHDLYQSDTVLHLPAETDIYCLLRFADVLITDYSGIYVDYLLLDRPIIHYVPDIEKFVSNSRSFYSGSDEMWAGPKATTFQELIVAVEDALNGRELGSRSAKRRQSLARRLHTYFDAGSSMRVLQEFCDRALVGTTEQIARKALEHSTEPRSVGRD
jgi:CDP-glycerol glycerophosphotransferase (TagB/SpsB family)